MDWEYAELVKLASEVGGPRQLLDLVFESGRLSGHKEMMPVIAAWSAVSVVGTIWVTKLIAFVKKKREQKDIPLGASEDNTELKDVKGESGE